MANEHSPLAQALGRIPSGLFVVSTTLADAPIGFLGSFVQQVGFEPPTVMVAIAKGREHLDGVRASGRFTVSILGAGNRDLMKPFFRPPESGSPFDGLDVERTATGGTVLAGALAWIDCRVTGEHATGDHVVVFGEVEDGARSRDGDPAVHLRRNGLSY